MSKNGAIRDHVPETRVHRYRRIASCVVGFGLAAAVGASGVQSQERSTLGDAIQGLPFRTIGPATMSGRIVDLAVVESDVDVFYVATATGGVWKTTNRGTELVPVFESESVHSVGAIALHPVDTGTVWVGTGERANRQSSSWGDGVYRSDDGGSTWRHVGLRDSRHVGRIVLHPTDTEVAYVAALGHLWGPNPERGLYRTRDGGASWERVLFVDDDTGVTDVAMDPRNPDVLYAASYQRRRRPWGFHGGGAGSALWKSTDGGDRWTRITGAGVDNGLPTGTIGRIGISIYRSDPDIVYVSVEGGERYNASTAYEQRAAGVYRSEDAGETWRHMSDWNPRPMYASQILVDPNDDQRIYMVNTYSVSDDGGRTFRPVRQSLHGDDRLVWVNPANSDHVMKADDGGLGISYDRGLTWWYVADLPVSQYYRVAYDMRDPYWVYGGLQDNGSWGGPNATYRSEGIINSDWVRYGGGDGFLNLVDTTDNRTLYTESQYLGLSRVDLVTGERTTIRPGDSIGAISARRNWTTWPDLLDPHQELGNAMAPANWDGPFLLSPHDANTLYAGTNVLWRSRDRGDNWEALGDLTTGADRRRQRIMGELPDSFTLSLDDGIPYWPSLTAVEESPLVQGVLYVGSDDGLVHGSTDGGATFRDVSAALAGLPELAWISGIEASRHHAGRVYVAANDYRNDDLGNYLFRSDDYGRTWRSITDGVRAGAVVRTVREDPRNPDVLWLGTEMGLFVSLDGGDGWMELSSNLPRVAVNDLRVHPRDNDLILGTHGRGIWILDQINAFQELGPAVIASPLHAFSTEPARQIRYRPQLAHRGDVFYEGENPPMGGVVDVWLGEASGSATADAPLRVGVRDASGREVAWIQTTAESGLNRVVWNLRHSEPDQVAPDPESDDRAAGGAGGGFGFGGRRGPPTAPSGPLVVPGLYTVTVVHGPNSSETTLRVEEDPRIQVDPTVRRGWTERLLELYDLRRAVGADAERARERAEDSGSGAGAGPATRDLSRQLSELESRIRRLIGEVEGAVRPLTGDQESERRYYVTSAERLRAELAGTG